MRYLPHTPEDITSMLQTIGAKELTDLFSSIPEELRFKKTLDLPPPLSELELRNHLRDISRKNAHGEDWACFLGAGCHSHYIPSAVSPLLSRGEFLTAYTPYQPEVSQGTLQSIFEYQTMVCEILGMEVSNASHYDGSTATAEAALMALSITSRKKILVARSLHPEYRAVLQTYLQHEGATLQEIPYTVDGSLDRKAIESHLNDDVAALLVGYPNFFGVVEDVSDLAQKIHDRGGLLITSTAEPLSLGLFKSPGEMGADIAVAEGQSFGNAMSFGGPFLGLFATKKKYVRSLPGRLVGETVDTEGRRGFVLTLATREQHIRREKASSNICTNVALCALAATITLSLWGRKGFQDLAQINFDQATQLKEKLSQFKNLKIPFSGTTFNEFVVELPRDPEDVIKKFLQEKILPGVSLKKWYPELRNGLLITVTEMNSQEQIDKLIHTLGKVL